MRKKIKTDVKILEQQGYHFLWIDNELWMWDVTNERKDQREIANLAYGNVLVAGYGLGIIQEYLYKNPRVNKLITVERLSEVIKECERVYGKIYGDIIIGDFYKIRLDRKFDCVVGDTWQDLSNGLEDYKKFKRKAKKLVKIEGKILAWGGGYFEYLLKNEC